MKIDSIESLELEAQDMQNLLDSPIPDDLNEVMIRGNVLVNYKSRSGKMLSDAKYHLNTKMKSEAIQIIKQIGDKKYSAKLQNALVDSIAKDERMLVDWIDRINSSCSHQVDWLRTVVSKAKEEMKMTGWQQ